MGERVLWGGVRSMYSIHGYGVLLDKERLMPLAESLPDLWKDFELEIAASMESFNCKVRV